MLKPLTKPIVFWTFLASLVLATVLAFMFVPGLRPAGLVARHLGSQLNSAPDHLVTAQIKQLAQLDKPGTEILVQALGSRRSLVSDAASNALHQQMDQWARMKSSDSSPRVAKLAEQLAAEVDHWAPPAQCAAADLVARILHWPIGGSTVESSELLANCEQVLQAVGSKLAVQQAAATAARTPSRATQAAFSARAPGDTLDLPLTGAPGGNLPIDECELPPLPPSLAGPTTPQPITGTEPQLISPSSRKLPRVMFPDERPAREPESVLPSSPVPRPLSPELRNDPELSKLAPASAVSADANLDHVPDLELIRRYSQATVSDMAAIDRQLQRRGFDDLQITLARRVADPDPLVRRQLAESLADLNTSPGPWLFWLSYDVDPMVRQFVVSLMATSQDPRLHRRLREMYSLETDERVRERLDKLFDARNGRN